MIQSSMQSSSLGRKLLSLVDCGKQAYEYPQNRRSGVGKLGRGRGGIFIEALRRVNLRIP
jgi:hypothetical protein